MNVSLNRIRETIDIRLDVVDDVSPSEVQAAFRSARVSYDTARATGHWRVPAAYIEPLFAAIEQFQPDWDYHSFERLTHVRDDNRLNRIADGEAPTLQHRLETVNGLSLKPYDEQTEAAHLMSAPTIRRFALFWKPGSGKTGAMIAAGHELLSRGTVKGVIVVAERPIAITNPWHRELATWLPDKDYSGRVMAIEGDKRERLKRYREDANWLIVHYGILATDEYAIKSWAERKAGVERPVIIFDESDMIKNSNAKRSRAAMAIRQECGRCWIASGTPAPNAPSDYENQLSILAGYPVNLSLTGNRDEDSLIVVHALEKGVYYLQRENPRKMPEIITPMQVDLSAPQRYEYDALARAMLSNLEVMDDRTYALQIHDIMSKRMQLLRLCSDPGHDSLPSPVYDMPAKWLKIDELLEKILGVANEKVVIWTRFRATAFALFDRYHEKYGASILIGGGEGTPEDLEQPHCRLIIATMQVGSSSISLIAARNAIYESLDDVSRNFAQSMARINRTGQTKECRYWLLVTTNTVEEDQFDNTIAKLQVSEGVLNEIGKPGRSQLIEALKRSLGD